MEFGINGVNWKSIWKLIQVFEIRNFKKNVKRSIFLWLAKYVLSKFENIR